MYRNKYLKYKNKYLKYKYLLGREGEGKDTINPVLDQNPCVNINKDQLKTISIILFNTTIIEDLTNLFKLLKPELDPDSDLEDNLGLSEHEQPPNPKLSGGNPLNFDQLLPNAKNIFNSNLSFTDFNRFKDSLLSKYVKERDNTELINFLELFYIYQDTVLIYKKLQILTTPEVNQTRATGVSKMTTNDVLTNYCLSKSYVKEFLIKNGIVF